MIAPLTFSGPDASFFDADWDSNSSEGKVRLRSTSRLAWNLPVSLDGYLP